MLDPMNNFDPTDRAKQMRDAETVAKLRAAGPGAADRLAAAAKAEPDPAAIRVSLLRKNFPALPVSGPGSKGGCLACPI